MDLASMERNRFGMITFFLIFDGGKYENMLTLEITEIPQHTTFICLLSIRAELEGPFIFQNSLFSNRNPFLAFCRVVHNKTV